MDGVGRERGFLALHGRLSGEAAAGAAPLSNVGGAYSSSISKGVRRGGRERGMGAAVIAGRAGLTKERAAGLEEGRQAGRTLVVGHVSATGAVAGHAAFGFGGRGASKSSLSVCCDGSVRGAGRAAGASTVPGRVRYGALSSSLESACEAKTCRIALFCLLSWHLARSLSAPSTERCAPVTTGLRTWASFFFASILAFSRSYSAIRKCRVNRVAVSRNSSSTIIHSSSRRSNSDTPFRMGSSWGGKQSARGGGEDEGARSYGAVFLHGLVRGVDAAVVGFGVCVRRPPPPLLFQGSCRGMVLACEESPCLRQACFSPWGEGGASPSFFLRRRVVAVSGRVAHVHAK